MLQSAEEFIDRLEFLGLLEDKVLANLRRQVAEAKKPISPQMLSRLLVDQGHLTAFQAKKLVGEDAAPSPAPEPAKEPSTPPPPAAAPPSAKKQTELPRAAPKPPAPASAPPPPPAAEKTKQPEPAPAASIDDDLGLAPSEDEPPPSKPQPKPAEEEVIDLIAVPEPAAPAAKAPQSAPATMAAPAAPAVPNLTPLDLGGLTPLEPLGGLTPLGPAASGSTYGSGQIPSSMTPGQPVDLFNDPLMGGSLAPAGQVAAPFGAPAGAGPAASAPEAALPIKKVRASQWDSPLLYLGGGGLVLLLLAFVFLYWVLTRGSADEIFQQAENDYRAQSYGAAQAGYDRFLASFPRDSKASLARVRRGMCKLRPLVESRDWARSLEEAQTVLPEIEVEPQFSEARTELATLLPDIAAGFAAKARAETDTARSQEFVLRAEEALKLVNNAAYIPTSLRNQTAVEPRIQSIQEDVALARRDINRDQELGKALAEIEAAVKAKKTPEAYAIRAQLIKAFPDLEANADLRRAVLVITEGEREQVKSSFKAIEPLTEDEAAKSEFRVTLAGASGPGVSGVEGRAALVLARGAVYALDASTGRVLWRRFVGFDSKSHPVPLARQPDADALLVDGARHELVRVRAVSGQLVWRLPVGEPFFGPVFGHDRIFITTRSGRVLQVDPANGQAVREASFPQSLGVEPALDARGRVLYQMGEHSNVYVLKVDTLACESVYYIGQKAGSVATPPLLHPQGYLFVAENAGPDYALLHVISADTGDAGLKQAQLPLRLKGRVLVPLAISSRRVLVITDLGQITLIEIDPSEAKSPAKVVVQFGPTTREPVLGYSLADEGLLWVADRRISKYEIQPANQALVRRSVKDEGDTFIGPLERVGDALIHVRRRRNSTGVSVTAVQVDTDQPLWQTNLATPLACPVQVDTAKNQLVAISQYAEFFGIDAAILQNGLSGAPGTVVGANVPGLTFTSAIGLEGGKLLLASEIDHERAVAYNPAAEMPTRLIKLAFPAGTAVSEPVAFRGGLLRPSSQGRVYLLNPQTGQDLVLPFQPRLTPGETVSFTRPAIVSPDGQEFVVADSRKQMYRVGVQDQPQPHLAEQTRVETAGDIVSPLAVVGNLVYGVSRTGSTDTLAAFSLPDLKPGKGTPLAGRVTWGPESVADVVFVAAERDGLLCLDAEENVRWKTPLPYGPLAGRPLPDGNDFILASATGVVWRVSGANGAEQARLDLGEPLGAGAVLYRGKLLLAGSDGVLHVVRSPAPDGGS